MGSNREVVVSWACFATVAVPSRQTAPPLQAACMSHSTSTRTRLQVTLHAHTAREEGHVSALICTLNPKTGEVAKAKPRWVAWGLEPKGFVWLEWV